ncbi:Histidine kinase 5 [Striga hermonthica]|uniref:histidine kinase n=1 Tax=Striga hermonthica TaxID=68872 RepID=A0A9N7N675_STRHE|nr:Histidine kinase 5 [Striga hermonthica]
MLATMSHEIRSPLSGVVSMAEILSTTNLDKEQKQFLKVMLSSGDLVLQLINDILDLSKVESGVMKLEATKFRPREVVKHVLQTAAASLQKLLTLEGHVSDDVPVEVIGDVLRIRQILTNLVSNAIKFTHEGKVGINLYVIHEPSTISNTMKDSSMSDQHEIGTCENQNLNNGSTEKEDEKDTINEERVVWIRCDVYDTGIGIPENAIPTLFKKYMQVGADTVRKYGGTGLGLAICKQLVELMGGQLTVSSVENQGSTFTFVLPYKVSSESETNSDDPDELSDSEHELSGVFLFPPRTLSSLFSSLASGRIQKKLGPNNFTLNKCNGLLLLEEDSLLPPTSTVTSESEKIDGHFRPYSCTPEARVAPCLDDESSECSSSSNSLDILGVCSRPKILLVEDNKINVMVAKSMMKQLGHEIDVVHNGLEALRMVQSHDYHLILMDICMPVMDGLQATKLIRSYEETGNWDEALKAGVDIQLPCRNSCSNSRVGKTRKRIPIVAMTANAMSESADECYANGMDSFVTKPITFQNLKKCLQQYLF